MNDTPPRITAIVREKVLERSGYERLVMGSGMFETARTMILASFPPDITDLEKRCRLCERLYKNEVDVEAYTEYLRQTIEG